MTPACLLAFAFASAVLASGGPSDADDSIRAIDCSGLECRDPLGGRWTCRKAKIRTGRTFGEAMSCRPADSPDDPSLPVLSGEVIDSNQPGSPVLPGILVSAWRDGSNARAAAATSAEGRYHFLVPVGATVLVRADAPGNLAELHAATVGRQGWDVPLDLRRAATLDQLLAGAARQNPQRGLIVVEFLGAKRVVGVGARLKPAGSPSLVFDPAGRPVPSERILEGGRELLVAPNVQPGRVSIEFLDGPSARCAAQASGLKDWPSSPGMVTQIDAECIDQ